MITLEPENPGMSDALLPNCARIYDYFLGGKDNYAADRAAADRMIEQFPDARPMARANRDFLLRAVRYCAQQGVDQFLDIGTGIPTHPAVHEVTRSVRPGIRVVGADNDPVVVCHGRALVDDGAGIRTIEGDLRGAAGILDDPVVEEVIDFGEPVAVLLTSVVDFVPEDEVATAAIRAFHDRMAPGSYVVMSHATSTGSSPEVLERFSKEYAESTTPAVFRPRDQILGMLSGFALVGPELVDVQEWHAPPDEVSAGGGDLDGHSPTPTYAHLRSGTGRAMGDMRVLGAVGLRR